MENNLTVKNISNSEIVTITCDDGDGTFELEIGTPEDYDYNYVYIDKESALQIAKFIMDNYKLDENELS